MRTVLGVGRVREWWNHKLAPVFGTAYATAYLGDVPLLDLAAPLAIVLLALVPGAAFVSLLNDLTDRESDRLAGKPNRLSGRSPAVAWAGLLATVAAGGAVAALAWRGEPWVLGLYAAPWVAFLLYSVPPARLKGRGFAGLIADAAGATLFPHLLVVAVVLEERHEPFISGWALVVGLWALAYGLRAALGHQVGDVEADARAGIRTFAEADGPRAVRVAARALFPLELVAFLALLVVAGSPLALVLLAGYGLLELRRVVRWGGTILIAGRSDRHRIAVHEYYVVLYPLAFLVSAAVASAADLLFLAAHLALFPGMIVRTLRDLWSELTHSRLATLRDRQMSV
jgi:4-hydroxybenzoate polyprenyltransferase